MAAAGAGEHHIVGPIVVVGQAAWPVVLGCKLAETRRQPLAGIDPVRLELRPVTLPETLPQGGDHAVGGHAGRRGLGSRHPGQLVQAVVAPVRGVQLGRLDHRQPGLVETDTRKLVALLGRRQVLHHQHELAGRLVDIGEIAARRVDQGGRRKLLIEAHLADVVAQRHAGAAALFARRGELADQRGGRIVVAARIVQRKADALADLAGADIGGGEAPHHGVDAGLLQDRGQPVGIDRARPADVGAARRTHAPSMCT